MSNYTKTTNFAAKDALVSGNPAKVIKGSEIDSEFNNIATAVATKSDSGSPTFTGTLTADDLTVTGTFSGTVDGGYILMAETNVPFLQSLGSSIGNFLSNPVAPVVGAVGESLLAGRGISDIEAMREAALTGLVGAPEFPQMEGGLIGEVGRQSQFRPFTVRGTTVYGQPSSATVSATGTELALSPEEAQLQRTLAGFGQQAFGMLGDPLQRQQEQTDIINMLTQDPSQRATREQDIFSRLQAMQAPETERARLGLEERLFTQGRGGLRTSMFGGAPEQLALQKAIQEQQSRNAVSAMEQARQEQALQSGQTLQGLGETRARLGLMGELGLSAIPTAYAPQQELLRTLEPQLAASRIASALQAGGFETGARLAQSALESQLQYTDLARALRQQQYQGLFDLLGSSMRQQQQQTPAETGLNFFQTLYDQGYLGSVG